MRIHLLAIVVSLGFSGCGIKDKDKSETGNVAVEELRLNEIVHDSLTQKQLLDIENIHAVFSEVSSASLEETITDFRRDQNPDDEIAIWLKMASAYQKFCLVNGPQLELNKKKEVFAAILMRSMMDDKEVLDNLKVKYLSIEELKEALTYYNTPASPLKIEPK